MELCFQQAERCDCMIAAGTSGSVYPAASLPQNVKDKGGWLIEANPNTTSLTSLSDVVLRGPTGQSLPRLVARIKELKGI
jgi:NAD-dependent deacetylase